jgi:hypothetical protein
MRINSPSLYRLSYRGIILVRVGGFEPPTFRFQTESATRLRYTRINWQKGQESNLRVVESKSTALPLGYLPNRWVRKESNLHLV